MNSRLPLAFLLACLCLVLTSCGGGGLVAADPIVNFLTANGIQAHADNTPCIAVGQSASIALRISVTDIGGGHLTYMWTLDDDTTGNLTDPTSDSTTWKLPDNIASGNYTVEVAVMDAAGKSVSGTVVIHVN